MPADKIREVLIELGNTGIKGCLKPNDYYNKKIDTALSEIAGIIRAEKDSIYLPTDPRYDKDDAEISEAFNEGLETAAKLFEEGEI